MATEYFSTGEKTLQNPTDDEINAHYTQGFVFTRIAKWHMNQTRSLRINLEEFTLNSENRRILLKTGYQGSLIEKTYIEENDTLKISVAETPIAKYYWGIHKLGKEFYSTKFGENVMSASKIKEMLTNETESNITHLFTYTQQRASLNEVEDYLVVDNIFNSGSYDLSTGEKQSEKKANVDIGYALCYVNEEIIHYAYPFYSLKYPNKNIGLGMMIRAILWAKENGKKYIYLGSVTTPESKYKLQFEGLEWYDTDKNEWSTDLIELKEKLNN
jgi:arginyl-tRNA--protein-N-Asp/Glu arginylyltransferase